MLNDREEQKKENSIKKRKLIGNFKGIDSYYETLQHEGRVSTSHKSEISEHSSFDKS